MMAEECSTKSTYTIIYQWIFDFYTSQWIEAAKKKDWATIKMVKGLFKGLQGRIDEKTNKLKCQILTLVNAASKVHEIESIDWESDLHLGEGEPDWTPHLELFVDTQGTLLELRPKVRDTQQWAVAMVHLQALYLSLIGHLIGREDVDSQEKCGLRSELQDTWYDKCVDLEELVQGEEEAIHLLRQCNRLMKNPGLYKEVRENTCASGQLVKLVSQVPACQDTPRIVLLAERYKQVQVNNSEVASGSDVHSLVDCLRNLPGNELDYPSRIEEYIQLKRQILLEKKRGKTCNPKANKQGRHKRPVSIDRNNHHSSEEDSFSASDPEYTMILNSKSKASQKPLHSGSVRLTDIDKVRTQAEKDRHPQHREEEEEAEDMSTGSESEDEAGPSKRRREGKTRGPMTSGKKKSPKSPRERNARQQGERRMRTPSTEPYIFDSSEEETVPAPEEDSVSMSDPDSKRTPRSKASRKMQRGRIARGPHSDSDDKDSRPKGKPQSSDSLSDISPVGEPRIEIRNKGKALMQNRKRQSSDSLQNRKRQGSDSLSDTSPVGDPRLKEIRKRRSHAIFQPVVRKAIPVPQCKPPSHSTARVGRWMPEELEDFIVATIRMGEGAWLKIKELTKNPRSTIQLKDKWRLINRSQILSVAKQHNLKYSGRKC